MTGEIDEWLNPSSTAGETQWSARKLEPHLVAIIMARQDWLNTSGYSGFSPNFNGQP